MKKLVFALVAALLPLASVGAGLDFELIDPKVATDLIKKQKLCYLAVAEPFPNTSKIPSKVYCVVDADTNVGTIHQSTGCTFMKLDVATGRYFGTFSDGIRRRQAPQTKIDCARGGFAELLKKPAIAPDLKDLSVYHMLIYGMSNQSRHEKDAAKMILVYATPDYKKWWDEEISKAGK